MSQYKSVIKRLAEQRRQDKPRLPPRKPAPAEFKEQMERIRAELQKKA